MPWPIPQPADITDRAAGVLESELTRVYTLQNGAPPPEPIDVRSPVSIGAIDTRVIGLSLFDLWLFQARLALELMPDTAVDWLARHAAIWGVPQDQPVSASGTLTLPAGGQIGVVVPADFQFTAPGNAIYEVINAGTIEASGPFSIGVSAAVAGSAGNLASGVTLTAVTPLAGLVSQAGTVASGGITGGVDLESIDSWRPRILERIRQRGSGGNADDFKQWTQAALQGPLVYAFSPGLGLVTVAIAMPVLDANGDITMYRTLTSTELSTASAYLNDATARKPLGAPSIDVVSATLQPVNFTLHLNPDTTSIRQGISSALALYFVSSDIAINGTLDVSRSDGAIDAVAQLYSYDRSVPATDVAPSTVTSLLTFGTVTFV